MCVPELPVHASHLGELRGDVRARMERRHGEVAPDEAKAVEAVEERFHRPTGLEAVRASEVPVRSNSPSYGATGPGRSRIG